LIGKELQLSNKWALTIDTKVTYAGGRRYTPFDLEASNARGREIRDLDQRFEAQYQPYFSGNLKIGVRHNEAKYSQIFAVDLVNITNHNNEFRKAYNARTGTINTSYQRGFFPNVLYQILF